MIPSATAPDLRHAPDHTTRTAMPMPSVASATPARALLVAALLVGVAGDLLLRGGQWRLGFFLWTCVVVSMAIVMGGAPRGGRLLILLAPALAAFGLAERDSEFLYGIDMLSVLCSGALAVWVGSGRSLATLTVLDTVRAAVLAAFTAAFGAGRALHRAISGANSESNPGATAGVSSGASSGAGSGAAPTSRSARAWQVALGAVLALPPLFLVASLLGSADAVFEGLLARITDLVGTQGLEHAVVVLILSWFALGWLSGTRGDDTGVRVPEVRSPGIDWLSAAVGLYGLVALLAMFVGTQLRVLFGGAEYLQATAGLTLAEYAREGFFQMVAAAGIVLATLVVAEWLLARDDEGLRRYRTAGRMLIALVVLMLGSAVTRMWLYVSEFGLSVDRFIALAVMCWVLVALATFGLTALNGRVERFAPVMLVATVAWVLLVNAVNPEAMVARVNLARAAAGASFDVAYHAGLSADALPTLREQAYRLPAAECAQLGEALRRTWMTRTAPERDADTDWRGRSRAERAARRWVASGALPSCAGGG